MQNAKLWKRILNEGINPDSAMGKHESLANLIVKAPIIVDARPSYDEVNSPSTKSVVFPFREFWLEGNIDAIADDGTKCGDTQWGALIVAEDIEGGWRVTLGAFGAFPAKPPSLFGILHNFHVDRSGKMDIAAGGDSLESLLPNEVAMEAMQTVLYSAWDTLELLACKNVSLKANDNDPKQVRRAVKRHGGTPESYRYHTLVVRPPGAKSGATGQDVGIMPLHKVRGHKAYYGPEFGKGLLFGKYAGAFFIPAHVRGDKKNGVVEKDYEVRVPASA